MVPIPLICPPHLLSLLEIVEIETRNETCIATPGQNLLAVAVDCVDWVSTLDRRETLTSKYVAARWS